MLNNDTIEMMVTVAQDITRTQKFARSDFDLALDLLAKRSQEPGESYVDTYLKMLKSEHAVWLFHARELAKTV